MSTPKKSKNTEKKDIIVNVSFKFNNAELKLTSTDISHMLTEAFGDLKTFSVYNYINTDEGLD